MQGECSDAASEPPPSEPPPSQQPPPPRRLSAANRLRRVVDAAAQHAASAENAAKPESSGASRWKQALAATAPTTAPVKFGNTCFDMSGKPHDLAELRERRYTAVMKGLSFLYKFFKKDNYSALHAIGDDAPSIFFECWYTSANSAIRMASKDICKHLLPVRRPTPHTAIRRAPARRAPSVLRALTTGGPV